MSDGIRLTSYGRPQLSYTEHVCSRCGRQVEGLGDTCSTCLNDDWWRQMHQRQAEAIASTPDLRVDLSFDTGARARHIVLIGYKGMAFCGSKVTQPVKKRTSVPANLLPMSGICPSCRAAFEKAKAACPAGQDGGGNR